MTLAATPHRQSVFYRHPRLYDLGIHFLYLNRLKIVKEIVGRGMRVFEPACGFGRMKKYLHPDCTYAGIDLRKKLGTDDENVKMIGSLKLQFLIWSVLKLNKFIFSHSVPGIHPELKMSSGKT